MLSKFISRRWTKQLHFHLSLPELLFLNFYSSMQHFHCKAAKRVNSPRNTENIFLDSYSI